MIAILGVLLAGTVAPIGTGAALTVPAARHLVRLDVGRGRPPVWLLAIQQDSANQHGLWFLRSDDGGSSWSSYAPIQDDWTERDTPDVATVGNDIALVYSYEGPTLSGSVRHDVFFQWWRWNGNDDWFPSPPVRVFDSTSSVTAYYRGLIAVDSEGRIWIQAFRLNSDGTHTAVVTVSTNGGGSFAQQPSLATLGDRGGGRLISLGTRLMFLYGGHGCCETGKMRLRSDSDPLATWSSAATVLSDGIYHGAALSAVADGAGGLHLAYKNLSAKLYYRHFDGSRWSGATLLDGTPSWALQPAMTRLGDDVVVFYNPMIADNTNYRFVYRTLHAGSFSSASTLDSSVSFKGYPGAAETLPRSTARVPCIFGKTPDASTGGVASIVFGDAPAPTAEPPPPPPPPPPPRPDGGTPDGGMDGGTGGGGGSGPPLAGTVLFADSFNRTSSNGLGPDWTVVAGRWRTDSRANSDFTGLDRANVNRITCADCRIDARVVGFATEATGFTLRETSSGDRYEMVILANGHVQIRRWTSGAVTVLGDVASGIRYLNEWATAAFTVQGAAPVQLTGSINASLRLSVSDSTAQAIASPGRVGLTSRQAGTWFDDFVLTELESGTRGGEPDGGTPDGGTPDGGTPDGGTPDGGSSDGGSPDAGTPLPSGVLFFDDFNRADKTGLGPDWAIVAGAYITDGRANSNRTGFNQAYVKGITCADCRIDARMVGFGTELALTLRVDPNAPRDRYDLVLTGGGRLRIRRWRNGIATVLGDVASGLPWLTEFESFSVTVFGTAPVTITAALNGTTRLTVTDGSSVAITAPGLAGITNLVAGNWVDDFKLTAVDSTGAPR